MSLLGRILQERGCRNDWNRNRSVTSIALDPDYVDSLQDWRLWRDVYKSGWHFVARYLEQFSLRENDAAFEKRKRLTPAPAFAKSAIMEVVNNIFQRMPDIIRTDGSTSYMNCLDGLNGGVDLTGSSMNYFMGMNVLPELLVMKRVGVYVDMPQLSGATLRDVRTNNIRPYLYKYYAEEITNWQLDLTDTVNEYSSLLLREDYVVRDPNWNMPTGTAQRYRHMWIGDDGYVHVRYYNEDEIAINEFGDEGGEEVILPIKKIPFVMFQIPHSLLEDAARYQVALLNMNSSDIAYCMYSNFPFYTEQQDDRAATPYTRGPDSGGFTGEGTGAAAQQSQGREVQVGTTFGRGYPLNVERPGFINPSSEPLLASMKKQDSLELSIRKLVNLSVIQLGQVQASAESKMMDNSGLEAGLSAIGIELERGERKVAEFWSMYENTDPATIHYPLRYSLKSDTERRAESKDLAALVPQFPSQIMRKEIIKLAARTLMGPKISKPRMQEIEAEIDACDIVVTDPTTIIEQVTAGILDKKNAAKALLLPEDAVDTANAEHADRLATISMHQQKNLPVLPGARGNPDQASDPAEGAIEKVATDPNQGQSSPGVNGGGASNASRGNN